MGPVKFDVFNVLNALGDLALHTARSKGFNTEESGAEIDRKLLLTVSELCEAQNELRSGHDPTRIYPGKDDKPEGFPIEMADAIIRILQLCRSQGIDIGAAVELKMNYNDARAYKHGRQF